MKNRMKSPLLVLALLSVMALTGCNKPAASTTSSGTASSASGTSSSAPLTAVQAAVKDAESLSRDELIKKAAAELGTNSFKIISVTSRFKKAYPAFVAELQKYNPAITEAQFGKDTAVDGQIYTKLLGEIEAGVTDGYSMAIVQDSYQLQKKGIDTGYFVNYVPKEWKEATGVDLTNDATPFALQYNFKTWMVNNANGDTTKIDNVWDVTAAKYKGKLQTMDPRNENVNMDWLIMLTQDNWCTVLKNAFEDASNDNASLDLTKYAKYGDLKKYAYAFIDGYLSNSTFYADDGKARDAMSPSSAAGNIGWIVYSKIMSLQETADVSKKNFTIAALGTANSDGNNPTMQMKGFGGFMYKHYPTIMKNSKYPYTSCALINYLSTTAGGYAAWGEDVGDYPTMPSINVDRTKFGHGTLDASYKWTQSNTGDNVFPCLNDPTSTWWKSTNGGNVVVEDPAYVASKYNAVMAFINTILA